MGAVHELFGIRPVEWYVLIQVASGVIIISVAIAWIAARPWISASPMDAVRHP